MSLPNPNPKPNPNPNPTQAIAKTLRPNLPRKGGPSVEAEGAYDLPVTRPMNSGNSYKVHPAPTEGSPRASPSPVE